MAAADRPGGPTATWQNATDGRGRRLRVLASAYACNPEKGSEPGVGWSWISMIAAFADLWVITRESNRSAIERALRTTPMPSVRWLYIPSASPVLGRQIDYFGWERRARRLAGELGAKQPFDIAHHLTYGAYWQPNPLRDARCRRIWGPVGGAERTPTTLLRVLNLKGRLTERTRTLIQRAAERVPAVRRSICMDGLILSKAPETAARLQKLGAKDVQVMSEVAFHVNGLSLVDETDHRDAHNCRFVSMGRLLYWKGFQLGLEAFAKTAETCVEAEYWIIGQGPQRAALEARAKALGLEDKVCFLGQLEHREALQRLRQCDVLVHPSMHDSGGWVSLEAMHVGKPVVCLALGGPALQVTNNTGFPIDDFSEAGVVDSMASAMIRLARDPGLRAQMGAAGAVRVRDEFSVDVVREKLRSLYAGLVANTV